MLGSVVAADAHLRRGALAPVSDLEMPQNAYQICCDSHRIGEAHVRIVHDWLIGVAAAASRT